MIVSNMWLIEHLNDPDVVILDSRGNVHRPAYVFAQLKIAGYENVRLYDGSFADWAGRRLPLG